MRDSDLPGGITNSEQPKIALCLSGGGFRAALFHLGALRRLNELGLLAQVDRIASVSGGSILSAHFAKCRSALAIKDGSFLNWNDTVAVPFKEFCRRDIRTVPILWRWAFPFNWPRRSAQVNSLMSAYYKYLTDMKLVELPTSPEFVFCSTDITYGVNFEFRKDYLHDYKFGKFATPLQWKVARAVAASSCFPPIFDPMHIGKALINDLPDLERSQTQRNRLLSSLRLVDGGVYDNLGLEPTKGFSTILISDGGAPFREFTGGLAIRQWLRYFNISSNQVGALRKRWFFSELDTKIGHDGVERPPRKGTYWGIKSASTDRIDTELPGYDEAITDAFISGIRTDLDGFTEGEMAILENHGYLLANRIIKKYAAYLLPANPPTLAVPNPDWMDSERVRQELKHSHRRLLHLRYFKR
jgi:NTE family protein